MIFRYQTSLNVEECKKKLKEKSSNFFSNTNYSKSVDQDNELIITGLIFSQWFYIWSRRYQKIKGMNFRIVNSFAPVCFGRLHSREMGTYINGYIGIHPFILLFLLLWFGGLVSLVVMVMYSAIKYSESSQLGIIVPVIVILLIFGLALLLFGKALSRTDKWKINKFIKTTLHVNENT
jgi:hypothetical protein